MIRLFVIGDSHSVPLTSALLTPTLDDMEPHWLLVGQVLRVGWSTARFVADDSWQAQMIAARPDIVVIILGTNDAATSRQAYATQLRAMIRKVRAADGVVVAWIGPPSVTNASVEARVERIASWQSELVPQMGAVWIDSRPLTTTGHAADGIHFTQAGYNAWAAAIEANLRQTGVGASAGVLVIPLLLAGLVAALFWATLRGRW